jgi:O-antigen/teichoic acid export membrane protein
VNLIHKNFIYNNLLGFTNLLIPILTFPYVSRVLGPSGIGVVSFAVSLTTIFALIGSLGIPIYGIREVAKVKDDKVKLSKVFSELFVIQTSWMLITLSFYYFWLLFTDTFINENIIKYVSFLHIFALISMFNWFFQGIENYRFITIINFIIKFLLLILLYVLVKKEDEYWIYYTLIAVTTVFGAIISLIYAFKFINFKFRKLNFRKHFKPILFLFSTQLAIGIYINLDIVFLNYFSTEYQVGLYAPASRLIKIILILVTSLGTVLIPKISLYLKEGKIEESKAIITKSLQFILIITLPITFLLLCLSEEIIFIFAGEKFAYSSSLLILLIPIIFLIGLSNVFGLQILVPSNKEKKLMIAVIIGAVISVVLNLILIPKFEAKGAAYTIIVTELVITVITFYFARNEMKFNLPIKKAINYFLLSLLIVPICYILNMFLDGFIFFLSASALSVVTYVFGLILIKDKFFIENIWTPILNFKK